MTVVQNLRVGQDFAVTPTSISLFDLQAMAVTPGIVMAAHLKAPTDTYVLKHCPTWVSPHTAILSYLDEVEAKGFLPRVRYVLIDNRNAIELFMEGILKPIHFSGARQTYIDSNALVFHRNSNSRAPLIVLQSVQFGRFSFSLAIISERHVDNVVGVLEDNCISF